jgi:aminoglycoside phosphotransferase (APT) family kinase protein
VTDDLRELLVRHLPGYQVRSVAKLGEGWDNVVHEVNGELVVRRSRDADVARRSVTTRREVELLEAVAELSALPVPEPVFADPEAGVLAYRKLPGEPLFDHPVADPAPVAAALGELVSGLQRAPLERMERLVPHDTEPMAEWLREAADSYRQVADRIPAEARASVEEFLGRPPAPAPSALAFCHNDLGSEHVLVQAGVVTGVIDWTDAAITDPVADLALIYRDLGPAVFDLTVTHYDGPFGPPERERAVFYARCALLEDLAYGFRTGQRRYADAGLAHLPWTFAPDR